MRDHRLLKILTFVIASIFSTAHAGTNELDPLNSSELQNALTLATPQLRSSAGKNNVSDDDALETELLLIERHPANKDDPGQRLADVYKYDYERDETIHTLIDLAKQKIISNKRHQYLQLPLTENEISRATNIIFSDSEQMDLLRNEYQRITGQYLNSPEQLEIKAFSFSADTLPERLNAASQQCGLNRCAQVLLYTHESIVFEISPIINLSAGIVTQNIGY